MCMFFVENGILFVMQLIRTGDYSSMDTIELVVTKGLNMHPSGTIWFVFLKRKVTTLLE